MVLKEDFQQRFSVELVGHWSKEEEPRDRRGSGIRAFATPPMSSAARLVVARRNALEKPMDKITELQMGQDEDVKQIEDEDE